MKLFKGALLKALLFALFILPIMALAKVESNYTLTPAAGQNELTPDLTFVVSTIEYKNNVAKSEGTGAHLGLKYYYGISDAIAVGAEFAYATNRNKISGPSITTSTSKGKGGLNPVFRAKGNLDFNDLSLFYSAGYVASLQNSKDNSDTNEYSQNSGQDGYVLQTGLAAAVSEYTLGAFLDYQKNFKGKEDYTSGGITTERDVKESSSHFLKVYMEFQKQYHLTGAFIHQRYSQLFYGLEFTGRFELQPQLEVIPQVTSLVPAHKDELNADKVNLVFLGVSLRYLF